MADLHRLRAIAKAAVRRADILFDGRQMDVNAARDYLANLISQNFPGATITVKDGAVAGATAFCFSWWLPDKNRNSLEIAVLFHAAAMNSFINATAEIRGRMSDRFEGIVRTRLAEGGYAPEDQSLQSFKVHIDDLDLD